MTAPTETRCPVCNKLQGLRFITTTAGAAAMASGYQSFQQFGFDSNAAAGDVVVYPSTTTTATCVVPGSGTWVQFDWCNCGVK